jgi:hypothetical protein
MIRAAVVFTALSAMTVHYRHFSVMFAILGMSFAVSHLIHRTPHAA